MGEMAKAGYSKGDASTGMSPVDYLEILLIDCGFDRTGRNRWLSTLFDREIKFLDELSPREVEVIVNRLKVIKADLKRVGLDVEDGTRRAKAEDCY